METNLPQGRQRERERRKSDNNLMSRPGMEAPAIVSTRVWFAPSRAWNRLRKFHRTVGFHGQVVGARQRDKRGIARMIRDLIGENHG